MDLDLVSTIYLPIIFYIGVRTSYEDWRTRKIKNHVLLSGFKAGAFAYIFLLFWNFLLRPGSNSSSMVEMLAQGNNWFLQTVNFHFFIDSILNLVVGVVVGFLLWKFRLMAAGDAKLFILFAWLIPNMYYWRSFLVTFPPFALLVNIFTVVLMAFILRSFFFLIIRFDVSKIFGLFKNISLNVKRETLLSLINKSKSILWIYFLLVTIFLLIKNFNTFYDLGYSGDLAIYQAYLMALFILFNKQIVDFIKAGNKKYVFFIIVTLNLLLSFYNSFFSTIGFLAGIARTMLIFVTVIGSVFAMINYYLKKCAVNTINVKELGPGDILSEREIEKLKKDKIIFHNYVGRIFPRGLNEHEVDIIRKWAKKNNMKKLSVYEHFPFAFWMFMGVVVTLLFHGSILNIFLNSVMGR